MNWRVILSLSVFGLIMALGTVYFISSKAEPYCWLVIFAISAYVIAKNVEDRYFLHGFFTSLANCVWITGIHMILSAEYVAHHTTEAKQYVRMSAQMGLTINQSMLIMGPIIGVMSGLVLGLCAFVASRFVE